jgi:outer membrane protein TolC
MRKIAVIFAFFFTSIFITKTVCANENERTLTFAEAAELAISSSAELKHARASQALTEKAWNWGRRSYFPHFNLSVSENDRLQQLGSDSFIKNYGINIDQLLWDGGRTRMSRNIEKTELNLSSTKLDRMALEIAESAIGAYRNILSSRSILEIKKSALAVLEEQRRILNEEALLGLALPLDLANADINLADTAIGIYSLELDLREMERQFAELLGLKTVPILTEKVDVYRSKNFPDAVAAASYAKERNPDLIEARFSITKKQAELKYASNLWIPNFRFTANFGLSGQHYPLTRYNWSVGLNIDFSNPWFQNRIGVQAGWEPPYDRTAMAQNSMNPLPDPASGFGKKYASLALALEQDKYSIILERIGRMAVNITERCVLSEQRRLLALELAALGEERCRIEETRLNLGYITRLNLMETLIEQTQREVALIEAATALLEAEHELERLLDLSPGELETFAQTFISGVFVNPARTQIP